MAINGFSPEYIDSRSVVWYSVFTTISKSIRGDCAKHKSIFNFIFTEDVICVAKIRGHWARASVSNVNWYSETAIVKCLDFGGYATVPLDTLKQIHRDFYQMPLQANDCYLANIQPINGKFLK